MNQQHLNEEVDPLEEAKLHPGHKDQEKEVKEEKILSKNNIPHEYEEIIELIEEHGEDCKSFLRDYLEGDEEDEPSVGQDVIESMHEELNKDE
jgi:hypothetical protein